MGGAAQAARAGLYASVQRGGGAAGDVHPHAARAAAAGAGGGKEGCTCALRFVSSVSICLLCAVQACAATTAARLPANRARLHTQVPASDPLGGSGGRAGGGGGSGLRAAKPGKTKGSGSGRTYTSKYRGVHQTFPTKRWEAQFRCGRVPEQGKPPAVVLRRGMLHLLGGSGALLANADRARRGRDWHGWHVQ